MNGQLPYGAAEIVTLRQAGKRPADMVLVTLLGPLKGERNHLVVARPERTYDWRFVIGLEILLICKTDTKHLASTVQAIDAGNPATLAVWFTDQQDGVNVLIDGYRPVTKSGRRMSCGQRADLAGMGSDRSRTECLALIAKQTKARAMANAGRFDAALLESAQAGFARIFGKAWGAAA